MGKSAVKVYIRMRPTSKPCDSVRVADDRKTISVSLKKKEENAYLNNQLENLSFKFESIMQGTSQEQVFTSVAQELCDNALMGYNGTIFAYGQTGSGKTYTIAGDTQKYDQRGIIPRSLHHLFNEIDLREDREVHVRVTYLEIYNEVMYDLLSENPGQSDNLVIVDEGNITLVKGLYKKAVANEEEALAAFFQGETGRSTAAHTLNTNSSRSHVVFTIHLEVRSGADEKVMYSKLNLVDLAGSERTKKTGVAGQALREAMYINKSLSFLEQTVNSLSRKEPHVPFRQTKLTSVLKDALGGNCKTVMLGNVWGEDDHLEETISTLRFASRVKTLMTDANINERNDPTLLLRKYERQIMELKQELAMRDTLSGRGRVAYEDLGDLEKHELHLMVRKFLKGDVPLEEMQIDSLKQIKETYNQFKLVHEALEAELSEQKLSGTQRSGEGGEGEGGEGEDQEGAGGEGEAPQVGNADQEGGTGFHVGEAPGHLRPVLDEMEVGQQVEGAGSPLSPGVATGAVPTDKHQAFDVFKHTQEDKGLSASLKSQSLDLKEKRKQLRDSGVKVNEAKKEIDRCTHSLNQVRGDKPSDMQSSTPEEQEMTQRLRQAKAAYRTAYANLKQIRESIQPLQESVDQTRQKLVNDFNTWFDMKMQSSPQKGMGGFAEAAGAHSGDEDDFDGYDQEEAFERMNMERILSTDPESGAFHAARKALRRKKMLPATEYYGDKGRAELNRKLEINRAR